jgi:hypothetical protein
MGATAHGLTELIDDLRSASERLAEESRKVVSKGSLNIKKDTQAKWRGARMAPSLAAAVSYDVTVSGTLITSEIGPDKDKRQGALGNIYEYGVPGTAPQPALNPALDAETPRFEQAVEDLGVSLLEGGQSAPEPSE